MEKLKYKFYWILGGIFTSLEIFFKNKKISSYMAYCHSVCFERILYLTSDNKKRYYTTNKLIEAIIFIKDTNVFQIYIFNLFKNKDKKNRSKFINL